MSHAAKWKSEYQKALSIGEGNACYRIEGLEGNAVRLFYIGDFWLNDKYRGIWWFADGSAILIEFSPGLGSPLPKDPPILTASPRCDAALSAEVLKAELDDAVVRSMSSCA